MAQVPAHPNTVLSADWLVHRFDPEHNAFQFVYVDRALRRSAPFLTDEYFPQLGQPLVLAREAALKVEAQGAPLHFLFHSAYCCSTLLARALDQDGMASSFKEPVVLNDIVGWRHRGAPAAQVGQVLGEALGLLARPLQAGEASIVKPSNIVNGLATAMMTMRPDAHAILLYAPLESFVASIARKGMWGRLWVRELLSRQLTDGLVDLGFAARDYLLHTDLQAAAVGWLAQHKLFAAMAAQWPDRVRTLNSEVLVARPMEAMDAATQFYGLQRPTSGFEGVVTDVFARNAKNDTPFTQGQRDEDRRRGEALHGDEIEKVVAWARAVAASAGVAEDLPRALIR